MNLKFTTNDKKEIVQRISDQLNIFDSIESKGSAVWGNIYNTSNKAKVYARIRRKEKDIPNSFSVYDSTLKSLRDFKNECIELNIGSHLAIVTWRDNDTIEFVMTSLCNFIKANNADKNIEKGFSINLYNSKEHKYLDILKDLIKNDDGIYAEFEYEGKNLKEDIQNKNLNADIFKVKGDSLIVSVTEDTFQQISREEIEIMIEEQVGIKNEIERKIKVRVSQGKFRENLLKRDGKCVMCGLDIKSILVASHIKPWAVSDEHEKQDKDNGILLCANHDALFDKGYITFEESGDLKVSRTINKLDYNKLNIADSLSLKINANQNMYMKYHRQNIFK